MNMPPKPERGHPWPLKGKLGREDVADGDKLLLGVNAFTNPGGTT